MFAQGRFCRVGRVGEVLDLGEGGGGSAGWRGFSDTNLYRGRLKFTVNCTLRNFQPKRIEVFS